MSSIEANSSARASGTPIGPKDLGSPVDFRGIEDSGASEATANEVASLSFASVARSGSESALSAGDARGQSPSPRARGAVRRGLTTVFTRGLYWLPVFAPMVLFAEIALLGLRPALCERVRLADAESVLQERYQKDAAQHDIIRANLRARQDPIFLERQRRWLHVAQPAR